MNRNSSQSGVALLMSLGILALLSILGVAFSTNMRLMERTTRDFVYEIQARYLAEGGIEYAIAELKKDARDDFDYDGIGTNDKLNPPNIEFSKNIVGTVEIKAIDTARQININTASSSLLACLPGIEDMASDIITQRNRMPDNKFLTKQSVALSNSRIDFDDIKNYITTSTYIDKNVQDKDGNEQERSAININTLFNMARQGDRDAEEILKKILKIVDQIADDRASNIFNALSNPPAPHSFPIDSWTEFLETVDSASGIGDTLLNRINEMFNPNRRKPSGTIATEFCFHSGGTYEITATGTISKDTQTLARKTITGTIKIFDLWNMTKKEHFNNEGGTYPNHGRVTWFDSCPVNVGTSYNDYLYDTSSAITIEDALKIGYWDDFSEDPNYSTSVWTNLNSQYPFDITGEELVGGVGSTTGVWPLLSLGAISGDDRYNWRWEYYSVRVHLENYDHDEWNHYDIGRNRQRFYDVGAHLLLTALNNRSGLRQFYVFISESDSRSHPVHDRYFPGGRGHENYYPDDSYLWITNASDWSHGQHSRGRLPRYYPEKTFHTLITTDNRTTDTCTVTAYVPYEGEGPFSHSRPSYSHRSLGDNGTGNVIIYGANSNFYADNIRIIGQTGFYNSTEINIGNTAELGTIWGTETIPDTAMENSEKIALQISVDGTNWYPNVGQFSEIDSQLQSEGGSIFTTFKNAGISPIRNTIRYRANFTTADPDYSETPVLEDVWITYLPKTKILYWREGIEEVD